MSGAILPAMEPLFTFAAVVAGGAGLGWLALAGASRRRSRREARFEAMTEVAGALGLRDVRLHEPDLLAGTHRGLPVLVETSTRVRVRAVGRLVIGGLAPSLSAQRAGLAARVEQARGEGPVETGDAAFDGQVFVRGAALTVRGLLDAETRMAVHEAVCGRPFGRDAVVTIAAGAVTAELAGEWRRDAPEQVEAARRLLALAYRLRPADDEAVRLGVVAREDPAPRVRQLALETLVDAAPGHQATRRALLRGLEDRDPAVRLRAALLGRSEEARRALQRLASRSDVPDAVSAAAIDDLHRGLSPDVLCGILSRTPRGRPQTDLAVLRALAKGGRAVAPAVVAALPRFEDGVAAAAAAVLQEIGGPDAEDALIAAASRPDEAVRTAVARALGALGSVRAVPALRELEGDGGDVLRAARDAVAAIQARLHGASSGQLALADGGAGEVSLAGGDGRLSLDRARD